MSSSTTATLSASNPAETPVAPNPISATREQVFALVAAGIGAGLPVPRGINIGDGLSHGRLELFLRDDDPNAVELWATWLNLPAPAMVLCPMESAAESHRATGWFQPYEAMALRYPDTGHSVAVKSYITVPAPAPAHNCELHLTEVGMSDCKSGCKVYRCEKCQSESVSHSVTYGCRTAIAQAAAVTA